MSKREVSFTIDVPDDINEDQLVEGLNYYLQIYAGIKVANPLSECEISELNPSNLNIR